MRRHSSNDDDAQPSPPCAEKGQINPKKFSRVKDDDSTTLPEPVKLPPPEVAAKQSDGSRIDKYITAAISKSESFSPQTAGVLNAIKPVLVKIFQALVFIAPYYKKLYSAIYKALSVLPTNVLTMIFGVALCFFGGTYVASIAAIEAFRQLGWQKVYENLQVLAAQAKLVREAEEKDDQLDEDGDGVMDVDQIEAAELAQRKVAVAMAAITEPQKLQEAWGSLFASYLAVLATLRLEFARTTAFALGIVEMAKFPIIRLLSPMLAAALGEKLAHWTRTIIETSITLLAIILAWFLQMIISAFYSGLRGGRMFADGLISLLQEKNLMEKVPLIAQPFDPNESYLDEVVGYSLAAIGFAFQIFNNFALPFPFNLIFLPLTILEWFLRIQISSTSEPLV